MRQPPARLEFNPLHPLAEGLAAAWHPALMPGTNMLRDAAWGINGMTGTGASSTYPVTVGDSVMGQVRQYVAASSQYFVATDNPSLSFAARFTLVTWVKMTDKTASRTVIIKGNSAAFNTIEYAVYYLQTSDRYRFTVGNNSTSAQINADNFGAPATGIWHCIIGWYDGANVNIQVNDGAVNSAAYTSGSYDSAVNLSIGANVSATPVAMDGLIGPVYMYNRALSAQERTMQFLDPHAMFRPVGLRAGLPMATRGFGRGGNKYGLITLVPGFSY